ncbi:MAG: diacylglycerol kinase family protein [Lactobacillaceae bacterium]|jgi:undecaprenol kinase|nr:diacylglycerol kinase family protein [Lactobacillaceae bacterium]
MDLQDKIKQTKQKHPVEDHVDHHQINKNDNFVQSFGHALEGIAQLLIRERNMRFHFVVAIIVIVIGFYLKIGRSDWLWIAVAIFTVVMAEFVNTMVEAIVDLIVGDEYHPLARTAKDIAAGAVVFAVLFALAIGFIIFQPYFLPQFSIY